MVASDILFLTMSFSLLKVDADYCRMVVQNLPDVVSMYKDNDLKTIHEIVQEWQNLH